MTLSHSKLRAQSFYLSIIFSINLFLLAPPAAPSQAASLTRTNTRQIGRRHTITLQRGSKGFGFGLTSRDVKTDEQSQPIYVKVVHHGGAAYQEGQLRIGDRILEVGREGGREEGREGKEEGGRGRRREGGREGRREGEREREGGREDGSLSGGGSIN